MAILLSRPLLCLAVRWFRDAYREIESRKRDGVDREYDFFSAVFAV